MYNDDVRNRIIEISKKKDSLHELIQMLSRQAITYYCLCNSDNSLAKVKLNKNEYIVIATSKDVLTETKKYLNLDNFVELDAVNVLKNILRMENQGVIINLGDESQLTLDPDMLKLLYREVVVMDLYMKGGAYVLQYKNDFLLIEVEGMKLLSISLIEEELRELNQKLNHNGKVVFKSWKEILPYFVATQCNALGYNLNNKDITIVKDPYLAWLYESPFQNS
ncbi:hypothetical protein ACT1UG_29305 [Bacillus paramycoides]|uniref:hypothetical protein n=1 Tax=Bacillus paramycoides TaxID=2026194 RepID=UPI00405A352B